MKRERINARGGEGWMEDDREGGIKMSGRLTD